MSGGVGGCRGDLGTRWHNTKTQNPKICQKKSILTWFLLRNVYNGQSSKNVPSCGPIILPWWPSVPIGIVIYVYYERFMSCNAPLTLHCIILALRNTRFWVKTSWEAYLAAWIFFDYFLKKVPKPNLYLLYDHIKRVEQLAGCYWSPSHFPRDHWHASLRGDFCGEKGQKQKNGRNSLVFRGKSSFFFRDILLMHTYAVVQETRLKNKARQSNGRWPVGPVFVG